MADPVLYIPGLMQDARAFLPQIVALGTRHPAQIYLPVQDSVEEMSEDALRRATVPALLLAGVADTLLPLRRQEFTRDLMSSSALKLIAAAGHLPMLEAPDAVTTAIEGFLAGPMVLR